MVSVQNLKESKYGKTKGCSCLGEILYGTDFLAR